MVIHESAEDYLETILMLSKKLPVVRSIDIANEMGYKKSSVISAAIITFSLASFFPTSYISRSTPS